ncbi:MAG: hypothetical protein LBQ09_04180 [Acidobacteriaceae bacterium]|nr:hypothetical protein [Acidobacteriaceae bacterium]
MCVVLSLLVALPAGAQDILAAPALDLSPAVVQKAFANVPPYVAFTAQSDTDDRPISSKVKAAYFLTLAGAAAGTFYNIKTTRDALDKHLDAHTFPLVWETTTNPADKNKVTATILATNGGVLAIGGVLFKKHNTPMAIFLNSLVGGATAIIGLHNQSTINNCTTAACQP